MTVNITVQKIKSLIKNQAVGKYAVGNGLYFRVSAEGSVFFIVRYMSHGKRKEMTLGKYPDISLVEAKLKAAQIKVDLNNDGVDPLEERKRLDNETLKTVNDLAEDWLQECEKRLKSV
ncbi:Arm DNA-binding domain-containing protein [Pseudoalteromonas luteoviolacea]|uniref:Integrase DNA-binding domain-containing protein n=1 Tax=Pseudoalteromonas luteoviolacea S4054 TaxID=1129367 RepID=A0A0F6AHM2_9GAMM|nr:hypothetical protein N479_25430 [Pseudoalteromonas luteoviolacea S4054]KZN78570.1 hypothetical protein N481_25955 [Pseudoalteromonas luteoviolacea S4047-1]